MVLRTVGGLTDVQIGRPIGICSCVLLSLIEDKEGISVMLFLFRISLKDIQGIIDMQYIPKDQIFDCRGGGTQVSYFK